MPDLGGTGMLRQRSWSPLSSPDASGISHLSADQPGVPRARLVRDQAVALTPSIVLLVLVVWSSEVALGGCNMRLLAPEAPSAQCSALMTPGVALLFGVVGIISWHTAYALRPLCWEAVFSLTQLSCLVPASWLPAGAVWDDAATVGLGLLAAFVRTVMVEGLRLFGHEMCVAVVVALARSRRQDTPASVPETAHAACLVGVDDPRFPMALWIAAGWAIAEVVAGSYQMFKFRPLYRTVPPSCRIDEGDLLSDYVEPERSASPRNSLSPRDAHTAEDTSRSSPSGLDEELSLDELILVREKAELEDQLRAPLESVAPATFTLWRIDSVLWNVGSCLLIAASLTHAQGCAPLNEPSGSPQPYAFAPFPPLSSMHWTLLTLVLVHTVATTVWVLALPRLGLTTITYTSMLFGFGLLFAGLGCWGALA
ncbi:hypothetical protein MSPP1_003063 [Malassezia sp. CBS 17886]|nr:hypothetical protein MSPP1_003063 [Malassezia sp. CBS 17886]